MCSTSFKNLNFFISTVHLTLLSFVQLGTVRNFKIELTEMLLIRIFYMVRRIETLPASLFFGPDHEAYYKSTTFLQFADGQFIQSL